jgi:hypothetical protein
VNCATGRRVIDVDSAVTDDGLRQLLLSGVQEIHVIVRGVVFELARGSARSNRAAGAVIVAARSAPDRLDHRDIGRALGIACGELELGSRITLP